MPFLLRMALIWTPGGAVPPPAPQPKLPPEVRVHWPDPLFGRSLTTYSAKLTDELVGLYTRTTDRLKSAEKAEKNT